MRKSDEVVVTTRGALWRSRWAAVGAAVAVVAGAGGLGFAVAAGNEASLVPVTPCRLLDTRPGAGNVGRAPAPLGPGQTVALQATGQQARCSLPPAARGVVLNVTVVNGTAASFLTVWPGGGLARPAASNINWLAQQGPTANQVTTGLSDTGTFSVFNAAGTVDVVVDAVAYLTGTAPDRMTPAEVGQRRWDADRGRPATFAVGDQPVDTVFDGRRVWVSESNAGKVQVLNRATGTVEAEHLQPTTPRGMAFDGTHVWVADSARGSVWRYPAAGGAPREFPTGPGAEAVAFDGESIWVANTAEPGIERLNPATGVVSSGTGFQAGAGPVAVATGGGFAFVALQGEDAVFRVSLGLPLVAGTIAVGDLPTDLEFDGEYLWVLNRTSRTLSRIVPDTGAVTTSAPLAAGISSMVYDGESLWVGNSLNSTVTRVDRRAMTATSDVVTLEAGPTSLMWDGTSIWATLAGADKVARIRRP